jgi:hypothetical protein
MNESPKRFLKIDFGVHAEDFGGSFKPRINSFEGLFGY